MKKNEEKEVKKEKVVDTTVSEIVTLNNKIKELEEKVLYKDAELLNYKNNYAIITINNKSQMKKRET